MLLVVISTGVRTHSVAQTPDLCWALAQIGAEETPTVCTSEPQLTTFRPPADVAQLVEHHLAKVRVASSNLVVRSTEPPERHLVARGVLGVRGSVGARGHDGSDSDAQ